MLLDPLIRGEARVQRRFDASVHWFMRESGWTKRRIRWSGWIVYIASLVSYQAMYAAHDPSRVRTSIFVSLMLGALWTSIMLRDDRADAAAEASGTARSQADAAPAIMMKGIGYGCVIGTACHLNRDDLMYVVDVVGDLAYLFQAYLLGTSPSAPKKVREVEPKALASFAR